MSEIDTAHAPTLLRAWTTLAIDQDTQGAEKALQLAADVIDALLTERDAAHAAGRKEALEEAIGACEYRSSLLEEMDDHDGDAAAMLCAADIRALTEKETTND